MREGGGIETTRCIPRMTSFESNGLLPRTIRDQQAGLSSRRPLFGVDHPYLWIISFPHPLYMGASGSIFRVGIRGLNDPYFIQSGNETCLRMTMLQKAMQSGFLKNPSSQCPGNVNPIVANPFSIRTCAFPIAKPLKPLQS